MTFSDVKPESVRIVTDLACAKNAKEKIPRQIDAKAKKKDVRRRTLLEVVVFVFMKVELEKLFSPFCVLSLCDPEKLCPFSFSFERK